jgi:hypothetical protein
MPEIGGRYLVATKCSHFKHKALCWDYPHPCGEVNIAYFDSYNGWKYASGIDWDEKVEITYWTELPKAPEA